MPTKQQKTKKPSFEMVEMEDRPVFVPPAGPLATEQKRLQQDEYRELYHGDLGLVRKRKKVEQYDPDPEATREVPPP